MAIPSPSDTGTGGPTGAAPPTPTSTPTPPPAAPGWTPPPETKPSRTSIYIAIAAVIVAIAVVLAALFVVGAFSPKSSPTGPMTFRTAEGEVTSYLGSYHGGNWNILLGSGIAPPVAFSGKLNQSLTGGLFANTGCNSSWLVANGTPLSADAVTSDVGQGKASLWGFVAANSTGYLVIVNAAGHVMPVLAITCSTPPTTLLSVPSNAIDSSQAEQAAYAAGEQAFVAAHPNGTAVLTITPGVSFGGVSVSSRWSVLYQACAPTDGRFTMPGTPVPTFNASINAVTGVVVGHNTTQQSCAGAGILSMFGLPTGLGGGPLSAALGLGAPTAVVGGSGATFPPCRSGDYCYSVPITAASSGLLASDIEVSVETSAGSSYLIPSNGADGGVAISDISGQTVVYGTISPGGPVLVVVWAPGGGIYASADVQLQSTMTIWVDLGAANPAGAGLHLTVSGTGAYTGVVTVALP